MSTRHVLRVIDSRNPLTTQRLPGYGNADFGPINREMFKDSVLGADGFNYHDIINHLLANLLTNEGHRLDERWDPEAVGPVNPTLTRKRNIDTEYLQDGYGQEPPPKTTIQNVDEKKRKRRIEKLQRQLERRRAKQAKRGPTEWRSKVKSSQVVPASDVDDE